MPGIRKYGDEAYDKHMEKAYNTQLVKAGEFQLQ